MISGSHKSIVCMLQFSGDNYLQQLDLILERQDYEIFSGWSMSSFGLMLLLNEIHEKKRKNIIEFGSGASSIVMARSLSKCNSEGKVTSIENDPYYCDHLNDLALKGGLSEVVRFIYAPLYPCPYLPKNKWYDHNVLQGIVNDQEMHDMVVIDGPPAWNNKIKLSRYGAIPFIIDHLADGYSIFLDDANRKGEKEIMKMWEERYKITFTILNNHIAVCRR